MQSPEDARKKIQAQLSAGAAVLDLTGGDLDLITSETVGEAYVKAMRWLKK